MNWKWLLLNGQELPPMAGAAPEDNIWDTLAPTVQQALKAHGYDGTITADQYGTAIDTTYGLGFADVIAASKAATKPPAETVQGYVEQWAKDAPEGATIETKDGTYTKKDGVAQLTSKAIGLSARGTLNFQRQTDANGNTFFSAIGDDGKPVYMAADGTPTPLLSNALQIPKNYTEEKPFTVGNKTYVVRQDPAQQGKTYYKKTDGTFTDNQSDPNVAVTFPPSAGDSLVDLGNGRKGYGHPDPKQDGKMVYRTAKDDYSNSIADAQDINTIAGGPNLIDYKGDATKAVSPEGVAGAKLPGELDIQKQSIQGELLTGLNQIAAGMKSGTISLDDGIQAMEQAVQDHAKNYMDASQRASAFNTFQNTAATQATEMAKTGQSAIQGILDWGNTASHNGSNVAGQIQGQLLSNLPSMLKAYGGGPAALQNPLTAMGMSPTTGLPTNGPTSLLANMKASQPVGADDIAKVKTYISQGFNPTDAVLKVAQERGIDTTGHNLPDMSGNSTSGAQPPPPPQPGADTGSGTDGS